MEEIGLASYPGRKGEGEKSGLVPIACTCAKYPNRTWGSEYDRIFSAFPTSICQ